MAYDENFWKSDLGKSMKESIKEDVNTGGRSADAKEYDIQQRNSPFTRGLSAKLFYKSGRPSRSQNKA